MKRRILVVDDEKISRDIMSHFLQTKDYEVITAVDGMDALRILEKEEEIAAVLLDIIMPNMNGYDLLRIMREDDRMSSIPVLVQTVDTDSEEKALMMGANDYIVKPFNPSILLKRLQNIIDLREKAAIVNATRRDSLTGLYNRETFLEHVGEMVAEKEPGYFVLTCFDIEKFKVINDLYGTKRGDNLLCAIADKLIQYFGKKEGLCCRVNADNFAILYPAVLMDSENLNNVIKHAKDYFNLLSPVTFSIGRYIVEDKSLSPTGMYDRAMIAKATIKGRYDEHIAIYDEGMRKKILNEQEIVSEMNTALEQKQFEVWYQPQYNHETGALVGSEALVRWRHPEKGLIPPGIFIPIFEQNGFVYEIDKYVWEQSCVFIRELIDTGRCPMPVSVNISRYDVFQEGLSDLIAGLVKKYEIDPQLLRLEITESAFAKNGDQVIKVVNEFKERGFLVEIDDFGSGYSSLNTLKDVPADVLKLDMKFLEGEDNSDKGGNIVASIVRMAKWIGMSILAEGVETIQQANFLKSIGCFYIQGYLYSKPLPQADYEKVLEKNEHEETMLSMEKVETYDVEAFWNPASIETLIFNSFVGGACIFEYHNNMADLLRVNDKYVSIIGGGVLTDSEILNMKLEDFLCEEDHSKLIQAINKAISSMEEVVINIKTKDITGTNHVVYARDMMRVIAKSGDRYLFYCLIEDITEQIIAEERRKEAEQKEMEAAQQLQVIMSNVNGGVSALIIDDNATSKIIFTNERYFDLYGYTKKQAQKDHLDVFSLILPEDINQVMEKITNLKKDGNSVVIDYRCRKRDGEIAFLRANSSLMEIEGYGQVITSVVVDITEQKLLASQLQAVIANINGGVTATVIRNGKPEFLIVNDRFYEILGYTKEQYEKECSDKFEQIYPDDREETERLYKEAAVTGGDYTLVYRIIRRDGEIRWIQNNINVIRIYGIDELVQLAVANDITEQREAEEKERIMADQLRMVLATATNGVTALVLHDDGYKLMFANDKYYQILGFGREEFYEKTPGNLSSRIYFEDEEKLREVMIETRKTYKSADVEFRIVRPNGELIWIKMGIAITHLFGVEDPVQICVYTDITSEKETNDQLRFLNDVAHTILASINDNTVIQDTLKDMLTHFNGDRCYVIEIDYTGRFFNSTYEICREGIESNKDEIVQIPFEKTSFIFELFHDGEIVYIKDTDKESPQYVLIRDRDIQSIIMLPLYREGQLIGILGIDNPKNSIKALDKILALGDYMTILLTTRDLNETIRQDDSTMKTLMDDTPGGFCRLRMHRDTTTAEIVYANEGYCKLLGMTHNEVMETYGHDAQACIYDEEGNQTQRGSLRPEVGFSTQFSEKCRIKRKDGSLIWTMVLGRFVRSAAGVLYLNAYFADLSEQHNVEEKQKQLLDNLPCGAILFEFNGKDISVTHVNKQYWKLVGREFSNNADFSVLGAIHPQDYIVAKQELGAAIRQKREIVCDMRIQCGKNGYKPFHVVGTIQEDAEGKYTIYSTYTPLNEQTMSFQEMLPIALSTVMSTSTDFAYIKDRNLRYICCSRAAADAVGLKNPRDIIGKSDYDIFGKEMAERLTSSDKQVMETKVPINNIILTIKAKDDKPGRLANVSKYPVLDTNGEVIGIYGINHDITDQKEQEAQLKFLTESIPGGIATFEVREGKIIILFVNDGFANCYGYSKEEFLELTKEDPLALMLEEDRPNLYALMKEMEESPEDSDDIKGCIYRCYTKDGSIRFMSIRGKRTLRKEDSYMMNVVQVDVTEQRQMLLQVHKDSK